MRWLDAARARFGLLFSRRAERRMDEEFRFHLDMQTQQNIADGMSPAEARRMARATFGGVEAHKEEMREGRGLAGLAGMKIDLKLGLRMLAKYPGLALVGGFGIAVAVAIGTGFFAFVNSYLYPVLPLDQGEQVVTIKNINVQRGGADDPRLLHDFVTWRRDLTSIVDLGAFRTARRNLIGSSGQGEPLVIAELSASGFRVARVPPLLGRTLLEADEAPGAPPVIVIGHEAWQTRFGGDPAIVGQTIRLGRVLHTIVGVMPPGFAFPINHGFWLPLRADPDAYAIGRGPELSVFGRIAPGVTRRQAQAELSLIGQRTAEAHPETHANLRPRILPYTDVFVDADGETGGFLVLQTIALLVLLLVCANVSILVYARTVTRSGEIAVRTALGATRRRIVTQLFAEALVLSLLSALVGLGLVSTAMQYFDQVLTLVSPGGIPPFWIVPGISAGTVAYATGAAVLAAVIVGILPGLQATGPHLRAAISRLSGGSKAQLGGTWNGLIIAQVALTVAILPPALAWGAKFVVAGLRQPDFAAEKVLAARLVLEREESAFADSDLEGVGFRGSMGATQRALMTCLEGEAGVLGVTFAEGPPGAEGERSAEVEGVGRVDVGTLRVGVEYLDVLDVTFATGRDFTPADLQPDSSRPVIVNRQFVNVVLGGGNALGRRIRFPAYGPRVGGRFVLGPDVNQPWHTIIGVVENFPGGMQEPDEPLEKVYEPVMPGELQGAVLLVRLQGIAPTAFTPTLRRIATQVDPMLELRRVESLDVLYARNRGFMRALALGLGLALGAVVLLSTAGIYALMSFTVNQRRREIGIRVALGAGAGKILGGVLYRASLQLALGVVGGLGLTVVGDLALGDLLDGQRAVVIPAVAAFMVLLGLLAAAGPARRGLRVLPTEALRAE